jgi:uncharacterized membrane protein
MWKWKKQNLGVIKRVDLRIITPFDFERACQMKEEDLEWCQRFERWFNRFVIASFVGFFLVGLSQMILARQAWDVSGVDLGGAVMLASAFGLAFLGFTLTFYPFRMKQYEQVTEDERAAVFLGLCDLHGEVESYRAKIVKMGRKIRKFDQEMANYIVGLKNKKEAEKKMEEKWRLLGYRSPRSVE